MKTDAGNGRRQLDLHGDGLMTSWTAVAADCQSCSDTSDGQHGIATDHWPQ